jgi:hypothetical protein
MRPTVWKDRPLPVSEDRAQRRAPVIFILQRPSEHPTGSAISRPIDASRRAARALH